MREESWGERLASSAAANVAGDIDVVFAADFGDGAVLVKDARVDGVDAIGFVVAERFEKHTVHNREYGRIEANADGEGKHDGRRE